MNDFINAIAHKDRKTVPYVIACFLPDGTVGMITGAGDGYSKDTAQRIADVEVTFGHCESAKILTLAEFNRKMERLKIKEEVQS